MLLKTLNGHTDVEVNLTFLTLMKLSVATERVIKSVENIMKEVCLTTKRIFKITMFLPISVRTLYQVKTD